jgi:uncharacterized membrane protein HdeD (DUF308 family)
MNKFISTYPYGAIIVLAGVFLLFSAYVSFNAIKLTLGISLIIGAIFAILTALSRKRKQASFQYHEMHALAMLVYGVSVLLFANTLETLTNFSIFLFFFYAFSEIIFCLWIFHLENKVDYKIVLVRVSLGLLVGVGTIVIKHYYNINDAIALPGYGILFMIIGINILLYIPIMKKMN